MCQSRWYSIGTTQFRYNTQITYFDELQYFGITNNLYQTFQGCTSLRSVVLPSTMTNVGNYAFRQCKDLHAILPSTITSIGTQSFEGLKGTLTIYATTPPSIGSSNFASGCVIYVPAQSVDAYKSAWSSYASYIQPIQE